MYQGAPPAAQILLYALGIFIRLDDVNLWMPLDQLWDIRMDMELAEAGFEILVLVDMSS